MEPNAWIDFVAQDRFNDTQLVMVAWDLLEVQTRSLKRAKFSADDATDTFLKTALGKYWKSRVQRPVKQALEGVHDLRDCRVKGRVPVYAIDEIIELLQDAVHAAQMEDPTGLKYPENVVDQVRVYTEPWRKTWWSLPLSCAIDRLNEMKGS